MECDDFDSLLDSLKRAGVLFRNNIISGPGGKQILAEDPSVNPIEIYQSVEAA